MMTRHEGTQSKLMEITMEELVPSGHFLRKLDAAISFDFVYDLVAPLYSTKGRPSIDPVVLVKKLLLGYLYGIDSERNLAEEVRFNIAYRWYLGLDLEDPVPDHSTFSQNRRRRLQGIEIFRQIFERIVFLCWEAGLLKGESVVMDSAHIKANADNHTSEWVDVNIRPEAYWTELNGPEESKPILPERTIRKSKNIHDPDAGYMNRTNKPKGFHYLAHECSDADTGIIMDVHVTSGDVQDCEAYVERYKYLKNAKGYPIQTAGLDSGYDTIAIHYGLTQLGIEAFIRPCRRGFREKSVKIGIDTFIWDAERDCYICPNGCKLTFRGVWSHAGIPCRNYAASLRDCKLCSYRQQCFTEGAKARKIVRRPGQEFQEIGRKRVGSAEYKTILRKRQTVCEGNFALQKRCHNLRFTRKRGIENVLEQCLFSALALNIKRFVKQWNKNKPPSVNESLGFSCRWWFLYAVTLSTDPFRQKRFLPPDLRRRCPPIDALLSWRHFPWDGISFGRSFSCGEVLLQLSY